MAKYIYEFNESPAKLLGTERINQIATKITVDGKVCKNRYGDIDFGPSEEEWKEICKHAQQNLKDFIEISEAQ